MTGYSSKRAMSNDIAGVATTTLVLDEMPFSTAVNIIKYCHEHGIDTARSSQYNNRISGKSPDLGEEPWTLEVPRHLVTWFRMKYGGLE